MSENQSSITDTFFTKLKEQSFTIILLVAMLWYQNNTYKNNLEGYKLMIREKDDIILKMMTTERQIMLERNERLMEQRDDYVEELINSKK
jgi:hypothetical protein